jgi:hypothetical protein
MYLILVEHQPDGDGVNGGVAPAPCREKCKYAQMKAKERMGRRNEGAASMVCQRGGENGGTISKLPRKDDTGGRYGKGKKKEVTKREK